MKRPYVICHILSSLDGKINGPFMGTEAAAGLSQEYGALRSQMKGEAWLYGTTTTKEFTGFARPVLEEKIQMPQGDFVADDRRKCIIFLWIRKERSAGNREPFITEAEEKLMLSRSLQSRHLLLIRLICGSGEFLISLQERKNWTAGLLWKNCMSFSILKKC